MELGSEFNLDLSKLRVSENSFYEYISDKQYQLFDSGRSALRAILPLLDDGKILMPEYICTSVIDCFPPDKLIFYRLKKNLQIDENDFLEKIKENVSAVYLMHYFGSLQPESVLNLAKSEREKHGFKIIEDSTHSLFTAKQTIGDYCVASLRKWFAIPNGGVLYSDKMPSRYFEVVPKTTENYRSYAMMLKTLFLNAQLNCNSTYRQIFKEAEEKLDTQSCIMRISDYAEFLLKCNDVNEMVKKRKSNLSYLRKGLDNLGVRSLSYMPEGVCPFAFPILVPDRDAFRAYMIENKIYCAIHWPIGAISKPERPLARTLADSIISLPIDQRYGDEEMEYMLKVIRQYKGRLIF